MKLCFSYQVQCRLTVLFSETRHLRQAQTVSGKRIKTRNDKTCQVQQLTNYLKNIIHLAENDLAFLENSCTQTSIEKGTIILQEDKTGKKIIFY